MRGFYCTLFLGLIVVEPIASQQIWDIWQTTWDRSKLFTSLALSTPINFVTPGPAASADIVVADSTTFQTIGGFGGSLTDSAALTLNNLKTTNINNYWSILGYLFDPTDGVGAAGLTFLRVPIGASDFSSSMYSLDDVSGDTSFSNFNINRSPSYLFSVIKDIMSINSLLKVYILPWSPPAWMKTSGSMNGGSLLSQYVSAYPTYLLKAVQGFHSQGITPYAISIQNEPENSDTTYPTCTMTPAVMGQLGTSLRSLLNSNGFSSVKVIGYEHNWIDAATYPVQLMQDAGNALAGVSFHCYDGVVANQDSFHSAFPSKMIDVLTSTRSTDWWSDIKWDLDNLWIGSLEHYSQAGLMWNIALDGNGDPKLPGADSCPSPGCRALVSVNSDGSYSVNQEFYSMAHASKAILPRDVGGPFGQRIGVSVQGSLGWALRVGAYATGRVSASDWTRYSLVVLNWDDSASTGWNPVDVTATIEFRGMQATYTFPVGVTTLWWYAPAITSLTTDTLLLNATMRVDANSITSTNATWTSEIVHRNSSQLKAAPVANISSHG